MAGRAETLLGFAVGVEPAGTDTAHADTSVDGEIGLPRREFTSGSCDAEVSADV